jgi:hypothetical protein
MFVFPGISFLFMFYLFPGFSGNVKKSRDINNFVFEADSKDLSSIQQDVKYTISVIKIDSLRYYENEKKLNYVKRGLEKIQDIDEARKLLKGIVEFSKVEEYGDNQMIMKINFRNGKKYTLSNEFEGDFFIAYFPSEDILLCEGGGHSADVSYNLTNGKETDEVGNPDAIIASPDNNFRLNGDYSGQDCYSYYIQKKIDGEFKKVILLDNVFEKLTKEILCYIDSGFWFSESILFVKKADFDDLELPPDYYIIRFNEKTEN